VWRRHAGWGGDAQAGEGQRQTRFGGFGVKEGPVWRLGVVVATRLHVLGAVAGIKPRPHAGNDFVRLGLESPSLAAALLPLLDVFLCSPARALPPPDHTPPPPGHRSSCYSPAALIVRHPLSTIPYSAYPPSSVRHPLSPSPAARYSVCPPSPAASPPSPTAPRSTSLSELFLPPCWQAR
jgi:hypothetical protein